MVTPNGETGPGRSLRCGRLLRGMGADAGAEAVALELVVWLCLIYWHQFFATLGLGSVEVKERKGPRGCSVPEAERRNTAGLGHFFFSEGGGNRECSPPGSKGTKDDRMAQARTWGGWCAWGHSDRTNLPWVYALECRGWRSKGDRRPSLQAGGPHRGPWILVGRGRTRNQSIQTIF